jgi:hypothetical protein
MSRDGNILNKIKSAHPLWPLSHPPPPCQRLRKLIERVGLCSQDNTSYMDIHIFQVEKAGLGTDQVQRLLSRRLQEILGAYSGGNNIFFSYLCECVKWYLLM